MHGPEKGNYENAAIFTLVEPGKRVAWTRESQPYFDMEVGFENVAEGKTVISFTMKFETAEECEKMKRQACGHRVRVLAFLIFNCVPAKAGSAGGAGQELFFSPVRGI